jgi:hypothetical protein
MISTEPNRIPFSASKIACSTARFEDEFAMSWRVVGTTLFLLRGGLANLYITDHD